MPSYIMLLDMKIMGKEKVIKIALNLDFENVYWNLNV